MQSRAARPPLTVRADPAGPETCRRRPSLLNRPACWRPSVTTAPDALDAVLHAYAPRETGRSFACLFPRLLGSPRRQPNASICASRFPQRPVNLRTVALSSRFQAAKTTARRALPRLAALALDVGQRCTARVDAHVARLNSAAQRRSVWHRCFQALASLAASSAGVLCRASASSAKNDAARLYRSGSSAQHR